MVAIRQTTAGLAIAIPDAKGVERDYSARLVAPSSLERWAIELMRLDTKARYRVREGRTGWWCCSCASFECARGPAGCKHIQAAKELRALTEALAEVAK